MGIRGRLGLLAVCVGVLAVTRPVAAESGEAAQAPRWRASADLGLIGHAQPTESLSVASTMLGLSYRFARHFGLGVDWGLLLVADSPSVGANVIKLGSSDPLFKLWYARDSDDGASRLQLSAGVTAPLAWLSYDVVLRGMMRSAYAHAAATRGLWNVWLWGPEQTAFAVNAEWMVSLSRVLRAYAEAGAALTVPISQVTRDPADAFGQLAAALELHDHKLAIGVRYHVVAMTSTSDAVQQALSASFSVRFGSVITSARAVVNLDPPLGVLGHGLGMVGWLIAARGPI